MYERPNLGKATAEFTNNFINNRDKLYLTHLNLTNCCLNFFVLTKCAVMFSINSILSRYILRGAAES